MALNLIEEEEEEEEEEGMDVVECTELDPPPSPKKQKKWSRFNMLYVYIILYIPLRLCSHGVRCPYGVRTT